jgi:hypothetical protein
MTEVRWSDEQLKAAVARLSDRSGYAEAEAVVASIAPELAAVLSDALGSGGWFGESHNSETLKAATIPDEDARLEAIRALLAEETHIGMMVGVAVGWALQTELNRNDENERGGD